MINNSYLANKELKDAYNNNKSSLEIESLKKKAKREDTWGGLHYSPDIEDIDKEINTIDNSMYDEYIENTNQDLFNELNTISTYPNEAISSIGSALMSLNNLYDNIKLNTRDFKVDISGRFSEDEINVLQSTNEGSKIISEGIITSEVYEKILKDPVSLEKLYKVKNLFDEKASSIEGNVYAEILEPVLFIKRELVSYFKILDDALLKSYNSSLSIKDNDLFIVNNISSTANLISKNPRSENIISYYTNMNKMQLLSSVSFAQKNFADSIKSSLDNYVSDIELEVESRDNLDISSNVKNLLLKKGYDKKNNDIKKQRDKLGILYDKRLRDKTNKKIMDSIALHVDVLIELVEHTKTLSDYSDIDEALLFGIESAIKEKDEAISEMINSTKMNKIVLDDFIRRIISKDKLRK